VIFKVSGFAFAMSETGLMKIGELSERSGLTARSIRYYEELGLIEPSARSDGHFRLYDERALARLEYIRRLTEAGLSLADVILLFRVWEASTSGDERRAMLNEIVSRYMAEVEKKRTALELVERELKLILETVENCEGCGHEPGKGTCFRCSVVESRLETQADLPEIVAFWMSGKREVVHQT
jgi:DNA-binding transcriptional MerR regulator